MKKTALLLGTSSAILLVFLLTTDPQRIYTGLLVVPFVLLLMAITSAVSFLLGEVVSRQKRMKIALLVAIMSVLLLILKSLGQLTVRDVFAVTAFLVVAYFYVSRLSIRAPGQ